MTRSTSLALTAGAVGAGLLLAACGGGGPAAGGGALTDDKVVLGVLNDQSGIYKDLSGPNSKVAVEMAIEDYQKKYADKAVAKTIEVVTADHQNKPDIANTKAQEMYDRQKADIILDVPTSSAALAVAGVAKAKKKLHIDITAGSTALTGAQCNKYTFHYAYDTWMLAHGTGATITKAGGKKWNLVYPDYAFGQDMQKSFTEEVTNAGGTIGQSIPTPFPNDNFATYITKAAADEPGRHRLDARRRRPDQLRQAVQPVRAQGQDPARRRACSSSPTSTRSVSTSSRAPSSPTPGTGTSTTRTVPSRTGSRPRPRPARPSPTRRTTRPR